MTDIVERLRQYGKNVSPCCPDDVCSEAAAEIDRLRDHGDEVPEGSYLNNRGQIVSD